MRVALLPLPAQNHEGVEKILKKMFKKLTVMPISLELSFPEAYALMQEQLTTLAETRAKLTKPKGRLSPSSLLSASNWDTSISAAPAQVSAVGREIPDIGTTRITSAGIEVLDIEVELLLIGNKGSTYFKCRETPVRKMIPCTQAPTAAQVPPRGDRAPPTRRGPRAVAGPFCVLGARCRR